MNKQEILDTCNKEEQKLIEIVYSTKQDHLFQYWHELTPEQRKTLLNDLATIDFSLLTMQPSEKKEKKTFTSAPLITPSQNSEEENKIAFKKGEELLHAGKIALFTVSGGQGTRLGYNGPKGCYPVTPVKEKSLLQIFAEKILALQKKYDTVLHCYIMTSESTDIITKQFFHKYHFFGLSPSSVHFIKQGILPTLSEKRKLILKDKHKVLMHPNGHGGALKIMINILPQIQKKEYIFYFQIDDVLTNIADPLFLGYHALSHSDMSTKSVEKINPEEKVGIVGTVNGKYSVIEYSDLSDEEKKMRDTEGKLVYRAGNIAVHIFSISFLKTLKTKKLPFHDTYKKINSDGKEKEVLQFETFIFDTLFFAQKSIILLVDRAKEFAPLKNKEGEKSLMTVCQAQNNFFGSWLEKAGVKVPRSEKGDVLCNLEISPLFALTQEDFIKKFNQKNIKLQAGHNYYFGGEQ